MHFVDFDYIPILKTIISLVRQTFLELTLFANSFKFIIELMNGLYFLCTCPYTFYPYSINKLINFDIYVIRFIN